MVLERVIANETPPLSPSVLHSVESAGYVWEEKTGAAEGVLFEKPTDITICNYACWFAVSGRNSVGANGALARLITPVVAYQPFAFAMAFLNA